MVQQGYQTFCVTTLSEFECTLNELSDIKLVLLDIANFNSSIWECCKQLQNQQIPFLIILPKQSGAIQNQSFAHGARSMLIKPLVIQQLLGLIKTLLGD